MPARTCVYASGGSEAVRAFTLDPGSGSLVPIGAVVTGPLRPGYLAFSPDQRHVYGVGYASDTRLGRILAFAIDPSSGALTLLPGERATGGTGGTHIAVHPGGRFILCAHFQGGQVSVIAREPDGSLGPLTQLLAVSSEAHQIWFAGPHVFVPCRSANLVHRFAFDESRGALAPLAPATVHAPRPGAGPRHMVIPEGRPWAYVLNELDGTITRYDFVSASGALTPRESVPTIPGGAREDAAAHVLVHPSGRFLYASNRAHHSLAVFAIDADTGRLTRLANETGGGLVRQPRSFAIEPTGQFLFVVNQADGLLLTFRIAEDGRLALVGPPVAGLGHPTFVGALALG
jgi:6-phosphogluconolactonase